VLPNVVTGMNTVIDKGPAIQAQGAQLTAQKNALTSQGRQLAARGATLKAQGAKLLAAQHALAASGTRPTAAQLAAGQAIAQRLRAQSAVLTSEAAALQAKGSALKAKAAVFLPQAAKVQQAVKDVPGQWKTWLWICVLCQLLFIPAIFLMHGRWTSKAAKEDLARHERSLEQELSRLAGAATA
jgi:ACS family D-galactonate transporter-like MFS transporter